MTHIKRLPCELWYTIYLYLHLSDLVTLSRTCLWQYNCIVSLYQWKSVSIRAHLGHPKRKYRTYYDIVISRLQRICELCFKRGKQKGKYAILNIKVKDYSVRMCLECRITHYRHHRESDSIPDTLRYDLYSGLLLSNYLSLHQIKANFNLTSFDLFPFQHEMWGRTYPLYTVVNAARLYYGGNIGIEEVRNSKISRINKLKWTRHQRRRIDTYHEDQ
ncbi:hypothetical protein BDB01DRAFT_851777 [Pilobolus umbonatus]|nr:hypothetical protein BDB01DRAFT_851777 [Pilobolus umbonatus]